MELVRTTCALGVNGELVLKILYIPNMGREFFNFYGKFREKYLKIFEKILMFSVVFSAIPLFKFESNVFVPLRVCLVVSAWFRLWT